MKFTSEDLSTSPLPPGLINQTNTCFFNSTLQALIATPSLKRILTEQEAPSDIISSLASLATPTEPPISNAMSSTPHSDPSSRSPLSMEFISLMKAAYERRDSKSHLTLNPRELLRLLGLRHGQYLDFRQQDAHEVLRQLLDAMDMEAKDEIKNQSRVDRPSMASEDLSQCVPDRQPLQSFVEAIFGGELKSFILCEGCREISESREPFMDLSLSLSSDEKARKRDILIRFAHRIIRTPHMAPRVFPSGLRPSHGGNGNFLPAPTPVPAIQVQHIETPRSQSVPPGSPFADGLLISDMKGWVKRRSMEFGHAESGDSIHALAQDHGSHGSEHALPKPDLIQHGQTSVGRMTGKKELRKPPNSRSGSRISEDQSDAHGNRRHREERYEAFTKAVFDPPMFKEPKEQLPGASAQWSSKGSSLLDGLRHFTSMDILDGENAFACERCWKAEQVQLRKSFDMTESSAKSEQAETLSLPGLEQEAPNNRPRDFQLGFVGGNPTIEAQWNSSKGLNSEGRTSCDPPGQEAVSSTRGKPSAAQTDQTIRRKAFKRYLISSLPAVLVIHLKRFQQITRSPMVVFSNLRKIEEFVDYPEILDLSEFVAPDREEFGLAGDDKETYPSPLKVGTRSALYRLYAVVVHLGNMLGGHYVAYVAVPEQTQASDKDPYLATVGDRAWYFVSDRLVRRCSREEAMQGKAYICFYERI